MIVDEEVELLVSRHRKWEDLNYNSIEISETSERFFSAWTLPNRPYTLLVHQNNPIRAAFILRTVLPKLSQANHVLDWWAMAPNNAVLIRIRPFGIEDI